MTPPSRESAGHKGSDDRTIPAHGAVTPPSRESAGDKGSGDGMLAAHGALTPPSRESAGLFRDHPRSWRENSYVYPVVSRRSRGLSIGINLNPDKACNFDCVYCCVDRTAPSSAAAVDLAILRRELDEMLALAIAGTLFTQPPFDRTPGELRRINDVAFSGDGEPTSSPVFADACRLAAELLEKHRRADVRIVVITNATLLHRLAVIEAMQFLDDHHGEIWTKLDAGTEPYYRKVERTTIPLRRVLDNILSAGRARPIVIQSLFMSIDGVGPDPTEIAAYTDRLRELREAGCQIRRVQIYTVARRTAEQTVAPLESAALEAIADAVRVLGLEVDVFPSPE